MLLIGNGKVITRDENNTVIENGAVVIDGARFLEARRWTQGRCPAWRLSDIVYRLFAQ